MNLIGQAIRHKTLGKGIVIGMEGNSVSILYIPAREPHLHGVLAPL